jgi:hypothetical protein
VSIDQLSGNEPCRDTRPQVGRSPTTPQNDAGDRTEPPVSSPSEAAQSAAATAMPEPDEEPPGSWSRFQGLRGWPNGNCCVPPSANSVRFSLPSRMPPAALSRAIVVASAAGTWSSRIREPDVVRTPAVSN